MSAAMNVLIVEDEMLLAMDLEAIVEDSGHSVAAEAACLQGVADLPAELDPELAFVDLNLAGGTSGLDVSQLIRQRWPQALIIFVTANVSKIPEDFAGAHGVIGKPFSHAGVMNALRYLAEGVFAPPPVMAPPSSLTVSRSLEQRWATA